MHVHDASLVISAVQPSQYPQDHRPEIALAGRSNVGKSSLINRLINRRGLARTSSQPGKTQTLNFYSINNSFRFVDVPGYGYARVSKKERDQWAKMIDEYLTTRENIHLLILLMDMRHAPTELDRSMRDYAESLDLPYLIVLTKADKLKASQQKKQLQVFKEKLALPSTDALFPFSSTTGAGSEDLWMIIEEFIED